jgi:methylmalonyl-CoA mutase
LFVAFSSMSNDASDDLPLAAEFPPASYEQWRKLAQAALGGGSYEDRLRSHTADGLTIEPLYQRAQNSWPVAGRPPGARWQVLQRIDHPDPTSAGSQAIDDLSGGANGLMLVGAGSIGARGFGLPAALETIQRVLDRIDFDSGIGIEFDLGPKANLLARALAEHIAARGTAPERFNVRVGVDPFGSAALAGDLHNLVGERLKSAPTNILRDAREVLDDSVVQLGQELTQVGFRRSLFCADGRIVHDAGSSEAQELAYVLASGVAMLRALETGGTALEDARRMIFFRLTADTDQFLTIAKFRALRRLWQRVEASSRLTAEPVFITAETAWRTMTRYDPTLNIVRATIAAFAAGIGGADAVSVLPFTAALGLPDSFARRVARNTQLVLLDEANLASVGDPTAGTGWSEDLTFNLCHAAWALLQEIEASGGAAAALQNGLIQAWVAAARAEREHEVATRRCALVGVNEFPDLGEAPFAVVESRPEDLPVTGPVSPIERLVPIRLAEPFEALRETSDRLATSGRRQKIFLATLGEPADYASHVDFAKNFFAAGGIEATTSESSNASKEGLIEAFRASGTKLACLCVGEQVDEPTAQQAAKALSETGAVRLYGVAGPGVHDPQLRAAGVNTFISSNCNMLEILRDALFTSAGNNDDASDDGRSPTRAGRANNDSAGRS